MPQNSVRTILLRGFTIETISRDRSPTYAEAARAAAPLAEQVADRWHLLKNLGELVEKFLQRHMAAMRQAASETRIALRQTVIAAKSRPPAQPTKPKPLGKMDQQRKQQFETVHCLHKQKGWSSRRISRETGLARTTVARHLRAKEFVPRVKGKHRHTRLRPFEQYVRRRWAEGERNAIRLWREICGQGFVGHPSIVHNFVREWRETATITDAVPARGYSTSRTARLLRRLDDENLPEGERAYLSRLFDLCPEIETMQRLTKEFERIVKVRSAADFDSWLAAIKESELIDLQNWAARLLADESAVRAALSSKWSNGQTEGQVNRLKFIKRQMYGRANFELLKKRVLHRD